MIEKKQIVFIMTDTTRWDMVGCYGNKDMKTPNIDRLADTGTRYERAYTCQPVCGPARSAIFTGLYPHSNGSWANCMPLGDNVKTIGQRLNDYGIKTAYIGKWHLDGGDYFGFGKCPDGWDAEYWYDMRNYLEELSPEERLKSRKMSTMANEDVPAEFTFGHRCANRAVNYLSKNGDNDFFLVVSFDEPHDPYLCPEPFKSMYKDYQFPKSRNVYDTLEQKPQHQRLWAGENLNKDNISIKPHYFLGCNSFVDYEIGRVIEAVEAYAPNAMIIFTSDHGDMLRSHSLYAKGSVAYDEIARIPLIIRNPNINNIPSVYTPPVSHIGLVPTILQYVGFEIPKMVEGKSLLDTIGNNEKEGGDEVYIEFGRYETDHDGFGGFQPMRCVVDGKYKLVINLLSSDELYDMQNDSGEINNLINNELYIPIRNKLHNKLLDWMNRTRDPFRGYYWENRPWRTDATQPTWDYTRCTRQRENDRYEPRQLDYSTGLEISETTRLK